MNEFTIFQRFINFIFDRKLFCKIGLHSYQSSLEDNIEEFGHIPLDNRICSKSICSHCGKKYKAVYFDNN